MRAARGLVWVAALLSAGCGYVGEPLPPLLHIPVRVEDLTVVERGDRIIVEFSVPRLSTEGTVLRDTPELDLRIGPPTDPWNADVWAGQAQRVGSGAVEKTRAHYEIPVGPWAGKHVVIAVRATGESGRESGWSNFASLAVVLPLARPADLRADAVAAGVRLVWQGAGPLYRIYRRAPDEQSFSQVGEAERPEWADTHTEYGKAYTYFVQAVSGAGPGAAESGHSEQVTVTPVDVFPPHPPTGLTAVAATGSIALVWERNTEPDFAAYRVYRGEGGGALKPLADTGVTPSYGDRTVEAGKRYRYTVSAVDAAGNESQPCAPVEATAQ